MSFFKDFKEDLSQAVNELLPEEAAKSVTAGTPEEAVSEAEIPAPADPDLSDIAAEFTGDVSPEPAADDLTASAEPKIEIPEAFVTEGAQTVTEEVTAEPEPEVSQDVPEPVTAAPAVSETPVSEPKTSVEPVFKESSYRPAPINTTAEKTSKETGVIIDGMSITGDVISDGNLDIMGSVKGNINLEGKLKVTGSIEGNSDAEEVFADGAKITGDLKAVGTVKIGAGTVVRGNVTASGGVFAGAVKGDIDIMGPVVLDSTAIIMGNIKSKTIQINNGAIIEGLCSQCYAEVSPTEFFDKE
ncbi:MAG: polymer-forming cytoskeletal protein [Lachnospiraceae bacterium]|nr:polymer-forming cytoskeletal protein [Lachnospiraceae bacterium]